MPRETPYRFAQSGVNGSLNAVNFSRAEEPSPDASQRSDEAEPTVSATHKPDRLSLSSRSPYNM
eukprot:4991657-Heterocapsa_arctica.AAC.1